MSKSPRSGIRGLFSQSPAARRKSSRVAGRRNLSFEALERRELMAVTSLADFSVSADTGEKPQSKVWEYNDQWFAVMPDKDGTWVWKLNGTQWQHHLQLSDADDVNADVKVVGNLAHILLYAGTNSQLATIEYDAGPDNRYEMWSLRSGLVNIALSSGVETATLEVDSTGRMWIASDASTTMEVRYADFANQYTNWSEPITVASGTKSDDISTIIAMPNGRIGVMWSNQNTKRFGFRVHVDGTAPTQWLADEVPASQSAENKGAGMADDHMHLVVASNGTIYAAVKTSYDSSSYPKICLLVRRPNGSWDNLYQVDTTGTRPIVMINEAAGKLIVAYTSSENGGNIYFKESPLGNIAFGSRQTLISGTVNNVSSAKAPFTDEVVAIAASSSKVKSAIFRFDGFVSNPPPPPTNQAPNVNAGLDRTIQLPLGVALDATVIDDGYPLGGALTTAWSLVSGPGTVTFANANSIDTTATFSTAGTYVLRLSASDGVLQAADTATIIVQPAALPPTNQAPNVDAGPNRSIVAGAAAALDGTVTDDGPLAAVSTLWTKVSGPGTVVFANASAIDTAATFSTAGTYVLRLTASDGSLSGLDEMTVTVASSTAPVTVSFQDGVFPSISYQGTRDTKLSASSKNTNYGKAATLDLDGSPDIADLLRWDLSAIPAGSVVESATIQLNITNTSSQTYEIYSMLRAWDELAATWNNASSGSAWGTAGALNASDRGATVLGTLTPSTKGLQQFTLNAAGIAAVEAWINSPSANNGFILQDYANSSGADFSSREATTAANRPKLTVTYRAASGATLAEAPADSETSPVVETPPANAAPNVNAGTDQAIQLPSTAALAGVVTDDGLPAAPGSVTRTWSKVSGPGTVAFGNPASSATTASFGAAGTYVLRLTASDGELSAFDEVTIVVAPTVVLNTPPVVSAGANQSIQLPAVANLVGTVSDVGGPLATPLLAWTVRSGPGTVTFGNAAAVSTSAAFSTAGTYVLRLTANDGELSAFSELTITVAAEAQSSTSSTASRLLEARRRLRG